MLGKIAIQKNKYSEIVVFEIFKNIYSFGF